MLKGNKVYLRLLEKKDIKKLYNICNEEKVKRYNIESIDLQNNGKVTKLRKAFSIINEENVLIGFITYREIIYFKGSYSIGITIGSKYWNNKYGEDSIKTLLKYLFLELGARRVELEVFKYNLRAINCYKKCGFKENSIRERKVHSKEAYLDTMIMDIIKEELIYI
jgi:diamine N-acetyltransferase